MNDIASNDLYEIAEELEELRQAMLQALNRAAQLMRAADEAGVCPEAPWLGTARMAMARKHQPSAGAKMTMEDTINRLLAAADDADTADFDELDNSDAAHEAEARWEHRALHGDGAA